MPFIEMSNKNGTRKYKEKSEQIFISKITNKKYTSLLTMYKLNKFYDS